MARAYLTTRSGFGLLGQKRLAAEGEHEGMGEQDPDGASYALFSHLDDLDAISVELVDGLQFTVPNTPGEPWLVLVPKNESAIEAATSTVH